MECKGQGDGEGIVAAVVAPFQTVSTPGGISDMLASSICGAPRSPGSTLRARWDASRLPYASRPPSLRVPYDYLLDNSLMHGNVDVRIDCRGDHEAVVPGGNRRRVRAAGRPTRFAWDYGQ